MNDAAALVSPATVEGRPTPHKGSMLSRCLGPAWGGLAPGRAACDVV